MNAVRTLTAVEAIQLDRASALHEALTYTAGQHGLPHQAERDIRAAVMRHIDPILHLADAAVAARCEYEAVDRRLDRHVRTHPGCIERAVCTTRRDLMKDRDRLLRIADAAYVALLGRRR